MYELETIRYLLREGELDEPTLGRMRESVDRSIGMVESTRKFLVHYNKFASPQEPKLTNLGELCEEALKMYTISTRIRYLPIELVSFKEHVQLLLPAGMLKLALVNLFICLRDLAVNENGAKLTLLVIPSGEIHFILSPMEMFYPMDELITMPLDELAEMNQLNFWIARTVLDEMGATLTSLEQGWGKGFAISFPPGENNE